MSTKKVQKPKQETKDAAKPETLSREDGRTVIQAALATADLAKRIADRNLRLVSELRRVTEEREKTQVRNDELHLDCERLRVLCRKANEDIDRMWDEHCTANMKLVWVSLIGVVVGALSVPSVCAMFRLFVR